MTDDQLLLDFLSSRDEVAFEALVRRYGPLVFRVCRDILGDREDAQDAFQATFMILVRRADSVREPGSVGRWLYEVASRISRRERRRLMKIRSLERQALAMDAVAPPDFDLADRELKPILHDEIRGLPSKLRDPIILCYFEGLTVEEVARRLSCPTPTLKSRLQKGRDILRSRLTRRGLTASALLLLMFSLTEEVMAEVPGPLLDTTVGAGLTGVDGGSVSAKVASMVWAEEGRNRWVAKTAAWSALIALLIVFGSLGTVLARNPTTQPPTRPAVRPRPDRPRSLPGDSVRLRTGLPDGILVDRCRAH